MLQRVVMSSGEVMVWGEAGGGLDALEDAHGRYRQMLGAGGVKFRHGFGGNGEQQFQEILQHGCSGAKKWIASANPPLEYLDSALRELLLRYYGDSAQKLGFRRWGVKEVQSGQETAEFLRQLFPQARFIWLVRNPMSCLLSIKRRNWIDYSGPDPVGYFAQHWRDLASQFRSMAFGMLIRYEALIADSEMLRELAEYLDIKPLEAEFIRSSRVDWKATNADKLTWRERRRILSIVGTEMRAHGYEDAH